MSNNLIENILAGMAVHKLNQQKLADRANLKRPYVSRIINGDVEPGLEICERIAKALDISPPARIFQKNCFGLEEALATR